VFNNTLIKSIIEGYYQVTNTIYTVYKTTNKINQKIYIGVHATTNPNDNYLGSGIALKSSIKKYGKDKFKKEILFEYDNQEEAYLKETEIVNEDFIKENNYNIRVGGKGASSGKNHHLYGKTLSDKTKQKISKSHSNRIVSQETKDKMSKSKSGKKHPLFGKNHSQETKDKMSQAQMGIKHTKHTKDKISKSKIGKKHTQETKDKMSQAQMGIKHRLFSGYYITPWGKFESSYSAQTNLLSHDSIQRWCKNPNKKVSKSRYSKSKYLQSLTENPLGKSIKELGFDFISNLPLKSYN